MKHYFKYIIYLIVSIGFSVANADPAVDFFRAVGVDNASGVKNLLNRGFNPNTANDRGQVGLFVAMREGSGRVAEVLLAHPSTQVDAPNGSDETPLMMAALRGDLVWARRLIERGAQVNRAGWTPLHYAATGPGVDVVMLLLERGADLEAPSPNGSTPLMMAARYGAESSAVLLLSRGARLDVRNQKGMNAADFAQSAGRDALAVRLTPPAR